jgi:haloacetate dehalogenase
MFEGFTKTTIKTRGAEIVLRHGGKGPPLLLMHGNPFTHLTWHKIAPRLAEEFTLVCPDLRGYGDSSKPPGGDDHAGYSFRAMAQDQIEVMQALGFERFYAAGHDRGARVLHRMCLDRQDRVLKAAFVDMLPQHYLLNNVTFRWGKFSWHWFFMIQNYPTPERMMGADPEFFIRRKLSKTDQGTNFFDPEALAEYIRCIKNPDVIHAMCEDYRATVGIDLEMDTVDFEAGNRVTCPTMLLWGAKGGVGRNHDAAAVWAPYATNIVAAQTVPSGHYLQEECPDETYAALRGFFAVN